MSEKSAIDTPIEQASARPAPANGLLANITRAVCATYLQLAGWKVHGEFPALDKAVLIAAPHTSNWDGVNMLATAGYYRVKLKWMGKKSLTTGPFGGLIKWLGCVPIDRSAANDVVRAMAEAFAAAPRMILAIPPEGTRSATREWKTGFYHIARAANVPLILSVLDYGAKTISLAAIVTPSGDYDADLKVIQSYYANARGKHADKFEIKR
ncbi:MAG: 1-acyl-sn-glycerol-3-phosphate acyltransferase [Hyphomonadaceae bacterium]|nr:1-acyl-sn-glycerol-3-phosphate acyltransferase [Hyphomonadaceae bacterium]MCA8886531.1 1-acyl-sn-glycerol-3-phosphate acyltransferase [Hyphomonadaceae bacterium]